MSDPYIDLPDNGAPKGKFLTLSPKEAWEVDYSQGTINNRVELLAQLDLSDATIVQTETTTAEEGARSITSLTVTPILLSVTSLRSIHSSHTPGLGVAGSHTRRSRDL